MTYGNYPDLRGVKRVLVVKLRHHGDVLLSSPVFSNLKRVLPEASIDALVYRETGPMLEGHAAIGELLLYDRKGWAGMLWRIWKRKYDVVINLTEGDRGAIAALVSRARIRVGFDPEGKGFWRKKSVYTHVVKHCKTARHTVERQLDALRKIGIFPGVEERDVTLMIPKEAYEKVAGFAGYVVIHPVSRWRFKCWPVARVVELIRELQKRGLRVVVTSSPDRREMAMVDEILAQVDVPSLGGKTTLKELSALIAKSRCLITVDSVPLHMASAVKAPVVALFGPSSEVNWGPWMHARSRVVAERVSCRPCMMDGCGGSKMSDCLYTLPVKAVMKALSDLEVFSEVGESGLLALQELRDGARN